MIPCRHGCQSPAVEIVYVPEGCLCFEDPVQALCEQHLVTLESTGPSTTIVDLRETVYLEGARRPLVSRQEVDEKLAQLKHL